jgi:hypothetical protein
MKNSNKSQSLLMTFSVNLLHIPYWLLGYLMRLFQMSLLQMKKVA